MKDIINKLDAYESIGWDLDGTLLDHIYSEFMHEYILDNPQKRHYLVTFRTYELVSRIETDLSRYQYGNDVFNSFGKIVTVPERVWYLFAIQDGMRRRRELSGPLTVSEREYVTWKGLACKTHGLSVMVDDNTDHVLPGCLEHGVKFINIDDVYG